MTTRITSIAAIAATLMITGCFDGNQSSDGSATATSASSTSSSSSSGGSTSSGGGTSSGGSAPVSSPPTTMTASIQAGSLSCATPQQTEASSTSSSSSLGITVSGNDLTQTFTSGSTFTVKFTAATQHPDAIAWQIDDYTGTALASGSINVPQGATTATL